MLGAELSWNGVAAPLPNCNLKSTAQLQLRIKRTLKALTIFILTSLSPFATMAEYKQNVYPVGTQPRVCVFT
jgi:hypothetical protein